VAPSYIPPVTVPLPQRTPTGFEADIAAVKAIDAVPTILDVINPRGRDEPLTRLHEKAAAIETIKADLARAFDDKLVTELLAAYEEAKRNFYLGGHRLQAVEGGRFCEAAFRMLEQKITSRYTPLGKQINS
jgi:hypothetical protein